MWGAHQLKIENQVEAFLKEGPTTFRHIHRYEPPEIPAWLIHVPEADGSTTPTMVFTTAPPNPGDKLALRFMWEPAYVVLTAVVMLPARRIPQWVVLQTWMGAAWLDALYVEVRETAGSL